MSGFIEKSDGVYPAAGLQFNPSTTQHVDNNETNNNNDQPPQSPNTPLEHEDSQEIMVGEAGKAILVGDEIDLESDGGEHLHHRQPKGSLCCPNWLKSSSPRTKFILGGTAILLLVFVAVMIVGISQLSSSPTDNNDNGGGSSSIITDENTATVPKPTPSPISSITTTTKEPTPNVLSIPITESQVNILFPQYLEAKVPDFSDGLSATEETHWNEIEKHIERTISTSLSDNLPSEYFVESVQIDKFDGFLTRSIRRQLQNNEASGTSTIHTVVYSTAVAVDCSISDCSAAPVTVASATADLSEMEYIEVSADTKAPVASSTIVTDTPTKRPVTAVPIVITPIPTIKVIISTPTKNPASSDQTMAPVTDAPTLPKYLDERINGCNLYTPCEACLGECIGDEQCDEGLLCFQRRGYEEVPGCKGAGKLGQSYCYDPFAKGLTELLSMDDLNCDKKDACGKCEGDCDQDEDCDKSLVCYKRFGLETVPGCGGQGEFGRDYCFDPADFEASGDF